MENIVYIILLTFFPAVIIFTILEKHKWNKKYIAKNQQVDIEKLAKETNLPLALLQDLQNLDHVVTKYKEKENNSMVEKVVVIDTEKSEVKNIHEIAKKYSVNLYQTSPEGLAYAFIATMVKDEFELMKIFGIKKTDEYKKFTKDVKVELKGIDEDWIEIVFSGDIKKERAEKIAEEIEKLSPQSLKINKQESKEKLTKKIMKGESVILSWEG